MRISFFNILDNSSVTVLDFPFEHERGSLQEPFFKKDDDNESGQKRSSSNVSQAVEERCQCGKCESMLTEKECRSCHEEASHYLNSC